MEARHSEIIKGLALVICSILLFPVTLDLMQEHDDAMDEYDRECDPTYRALTGNSSALDQALCNSLEDAMTKKARVFMAGLSAFILTGLVGLAMVLPGNETEK